MNKSYQENYSKLEPSVLNSKDRLKKANTLLRVLQEHIGKEHLKQLKVLNIGGSSAIMDNHLAEYVHEITSIDIDKNALELANSYPLKENLTVQWGDALQLDFPNESIDLIICSHVYEHVTNATRMISEISRVLKSGGICFFAAGNRLCWNEPHHNLPLLSVFPKIVANKYLHALRGIPQYYETHLTYWSLKKLVHQFNITDYTYSTVENPVKFGTSYMIKPGTLKQRLAKIITKYFNFITPSYIWILEKPHKK